MAALAPATDIKSTTLESGLLEVAQKLQMAEQAVTVNPQNRVQVSFNGDGKTVTISANLAVSAVTDATGALKLIADVYC